MTLDQARRAVANVSLRICAPKDCTGDLERDERHLRMILVPEQGKWRVWDLIFLFKGQKPDSFRAGLTGDIDANRKALKEAQENPQVRPPREHALRRIRASRLPMELSTPRLRIEFVLFICGRAERD